MKSILGKYIDYDTILHKIDPRIKMFSLILLMVVIFLPFGNYTNRFLVLGVITILTMFLMIVGRVSFFSFFKSLKAMWFMIFFLFIFMFFIPQGGDYILYDFKNGYILYYDNLFNVLHIILRLVLMIALTIILTATTKPTDITYALEWYLTPLKIFKFPIQIVSLTISLALRFIPTLLNETYRIMNAQKSRGVDYNRGFITTKIKSITTLIIPLLISCFSRSDELATAMEARGYNPYSKRSRYRVLKFSYRDLISLIVVILFSSGIITISILSSNLEGFNDIIQYIWGIKTM